MVAHAIVMRAVILFGQVCLFSHSKSTCPCKPLSTCKLLVDYLLPPPVRMPHGICMPLKMTVSMMNSKKQVKGIWQDTIAPHNAISHQALFSTGSCASYAAKEHAWHDSTHCDR